MKQKPPRSAKQISFDEMKIRKAELNSMCQILDQEILDHIDEIQDFEKKIEKLQAKIELYQDMVKGNELEILRKTKNHHQLFDDVLRYERLIGKHFNGDKLMSATDIKLREQRRA